MANEGEPSSYLVPGSLVNDPEGSVSIIDMRRGPAFLTQDDVRTATFNDSILKTNRESIRIFGPGATLAQDLEPEYIDISQDSKTAWVTLQENNAMAILDIEKAKFTRLVGLEFKDHYLPGNGLDASDQDLAVDNGALKDGINIKNWPVFGMYQPDGIASYQVGGQTYLVMANEGDSRSDWPGFVEDLRVNSAVYSLDPGVFPDFATLDSNANLGRLTVTKASGNTDGDILRSWHDRCYLWFSRKGGKTNVPCNINLDGFVYLQRSDRRQNFFCLCSEFLGGDRNEHFAIKRITARTSSAAATGGYARRRGWNGEIFS